MKLSPVQFNDLVNNPKVKVRNPLLAIDPKIVFDEYLRLGSVHRVGDRHEVSGETVRRFLHDQGFQLNNEHWKEYELSAVRVAYADPNGFDLKALAYRLRRTHAAVACKAEELGVTAARGTQIRTEATRKKLSDVNKERMSDPVKREALRQRAVDFHATNEHPRGMLGKKHSAKVRQGMSDRSKKMWADPSHIVNSQEHRQKISDWSTKTRSKLTASSPFSFAKSGHREDINLFVRSSWEANYARYLNFLIETEGLILKWEYEPETFWFEAIKRGCRSYKPDFKVTFKNGTVEYHEVKGWLYPKAKTALNRMAKYHPSVKIVLIDAGRYKGIARSMRSIIPHWERPASGYKARTP